MLFLLIRLDVQVINSCFILWYLLEMSMKLLAFGLRGYLSYRNNIFDGFLTILLMVRRSHTVTALSFALL